MSNRMRIAKCVAAVMGIFLVGAGVAFNAQAQLGNDAVGIFYDGIRSLLGLSTQQLGVASYVVNIGIAAILLLVGRRYVNIGTLIYILPYGFFVNVGISLYEMMFQGGGMYARLLAVIVGCLSICMGVALFIVADIGVDPLTGLTLRLGEALKWEYKKMKILFDASLTALGFVMGGKFGVITLVVTLLGGPTIQFFVDLIKKAVAFARQNKAVARGAL